MTSSLAAARGARPAAALCAGLAWIAGATACSDEAMPARDAAAPPSASAQREAPSTRAKTPSDEEIARLRALGYLSFAPDEEKDDLSRRGVVQRDPARSYPGYNLYSEQYDAIAVLIDAEGRERHHFSDPGARYWARTALLPDGDLIAVGAEDRGTKRSEIDPSQRYVMRMSWNGEQKWKRQVAAHHDIEILPDGNFATFAMVDRKIPAIDASMPVRDDVIVTLSPEGEILRQTSLYDLLSSGPLPFEFQDVAPYVDGRDQTRVSKGKEPVSRDSVDLFHCNSLQLFDQPQLRGQHPIYADDSLLVTCRHQDRIFVVSEFAGELRWEWGLGKLAGPHDATWLPNGNLLVLDNGLGRNWSRVIEVDPRSNEIVWSYQATPPESFYTASRGSVQALPNDNVLVTVSATGRAFEITRAGEIVWDFWNPRVSRGKRIRRAALGRMRRLPASQIDPLLERLGGRAPAPAPDTQITPTS